jgi:hypothetical protein
VVLSDDEIRRPSPFPVAHDQELVFENLQNLSLGKPVPGDLVGVLVVECEAEYLRR